MVSDAGTYDQLVEQQHVNDLVIEIRPDTITPDNLRMFRRLGCAKFKLTFRARRNHDANQRQMSVAQIKRSTFSLIKLVQFKIHSHLMVNLLGTTPEADKRDFKTLSRIQDFLLMKLSSTLLHWYLETQLVRYREVHGIIRQR